MNGRSRLGTHHWRRRRSRFLLLFVIFDLFLRPTPTESQYSFVSPSSAQSCYFPDGEVSSCTSTIDNILGDSNDETCTTISRGKHTYGEFYFNLKEHYSGLIVTINGSSIAMNKLDPINQLDVFGWNYDQSTNPASKRKMSRCQRLTAKSVSYDELIQFEFYCSCSDPGCYVLHFYVLNLFATESPSVCGLRISTDGWTWDDWETSVNVASSLCTQTKEGACTDPALYNNCSAGDYSPQTRACASLGKPWVYDYDDLPVSGQVFLIKGKCLATSSITMNLYKAESDDIVLSVNYDVGLNKFTVDSGTPDEYTDVTPVPTAAGDHYIITMTVDETQFHIQWNSFSATSSRSSSEESINKLSLEVTPDGSAEFYEVKVFDKPWSWETLSPAGDWSQPVLTSSACSQSRALTACLPPQSQFGINEYDSSALVTYYSNKCDGDATTEERTCPTLSQSEKSITLDGGLKVGQQFIVKGKLIAEDWLSFKIQGGSTVALLLGIRQTTSVVHTSAVNGAGANWQDTNWFDSTQPIRVGYTFTVTITVEANLYRINIVSYETKEFTSTNVVSAALSDLTTFITGHSNGVDIYSIEIIDP